MCVAADMRFCFEAVLSLCRGHRACFEATHAERDQRPYVGFGSRGDRTGVAVTGRSG